MLRKKSKRGPEKMRLPLKANDAAAAIRLLLEQYRRSEHRQDLLWLGKKLGKIREGDAFSYKYLHSVLHGYYQAGGGLLYALTLALLEQDGTTPFQAQAKKVTLLSTDDLDGCIISGERHMCEKPGCSIEFVRTSKSRKYCYSCSPPRRER